MKKKAVWTISILLVICIGLLSLSGCFHFNKFIQKVNKRHDTLKLAQVYQLISGDVVLDIENYGVITYADDVEYTLNDGKDWHIATRNLQSEYYYFEIEESHYGNTYDIAVRIAEDKDNKVGKKSNAITFFVKAPSKVKEETVNGFYATIGNKTPIEGTYKFVAENNNVVLKRYYKDQSGNIVLKPIDNEDRINVEYRIFANEDIVSEEEISLAKDVIENFEVQKMLKDENDLYDLAKTFEVFIKYGAMQDKDSDPIEWTDYNYDNGISKDEYSQSIVAGFDFEEEYIIRTGKLFFMLVRVKGDDTTLMSGTFIVKCWV
ncbi:MAG: hypothetical protein K2L70_07045 [Clostridia bacterium]|nr:hypothetical protein [Clostridia bacterium]